MAVAYINRETDIAVSMAISNMLQRNVKRIILQGDIMRYCVTYKVDARYTTVVEANNLEEARSKADANYFGADFGAIDEVVSSEAIIVEDVNGNYVWGK